MKIKHILKKAIAIGLAISAVTSSFTVYADNSKADLNKPYIALGADLNADERAEVLKLLGVTEDELVNYTVATVTNAMEHEYLDNYLAAEVIGTRSLSSVKVIGKEKGNGIQVTTKNISYCTTGMYQNALATAGMQDAEVVVAGPFAISGTAALVGAMEAYENMTGEIIEAENVEAATNELVVTSELGEILGDQEKAETLIGAVKDIIIADEIVDPVEIEETIRDTAEKLEISLTDEEIQQIVDLMKKIASLDLDVDALKAQAKELYDKLSGLDVDLNISESDVERFFEKFGLSGLWEKIKGIFMG